MDVLYAKNKGIVKVVAVNLITGKIFTKYYFLLDILHIYVILSYGERVSSIL